MMYSEPNLVLAEPLRLCVLLFGLLWILDIKRIGRIRFLLSELGSYVGAVAGFWGHGHDFHFAFDGESEEGDFAFDF
jgi:hypothetical protein